MEFELEEPAELGAGAGSPTHREQGDKAAPKLSSHEIRERGANAPAGQGPAFLRPGARASLLVVSWERQPPPRLSPSQAGWSAPHPHGGDRAACGQQSSPLVSELPKFPGTETTPRKYVLNRWSSPGLGPGFVSPLRKRGSYFPGVTWAPM